MVKIYRIQSIYDLERPKCYLHALELPGIIDNLLFVLLVRLVEVVSFSGIDLAGSFVSFSSISILLWA